ncbi:hypothetical protein BHE74_00015501 [Ensete ventricosum]|nr:hypothetical protein BHE74_00015501 [Ensete ventricosum]
MRGRSLASSGSSPSSSKVLTLMQEQRSMEAKKADTTLPPTQFATPSSLSYVVTMLWELSSVAILPDPSTPGFAFSAASVLRGLTEIRRPKLRIQRRANARPPFRSFRPNIILKTELLLLLLLLFLLFLITNIVINYYYCCYYYYYFYYY